MPLFFVLASGGGVHGSGLDMADLYFLLVVLTITNFSSESLCFCSECFIMVSFLA